MNHSKKKPSYPISKSLRNYLVEFDREAKIPVSYDDLIRWTGGIPVMDDKGHDTLWESVVYENAMQKEIYEGLTAIYALLKTGGDIDVISHLEVSRVDYCHFGNSNPFRVRIVNLMNDNHDYFYIKRADASRIYGLELEHILSPNRIGYVVDGETLIEEHIMGIPGDIFIDSYMELPNFHSVGMAKEFVKFNERCFAMLLGDMRSYNYVVDVTPDFDMERYRVRVIDFDQCCYEGRRNHYKPQYYKENNKVVRFCMEQLTPETVNQYQYEERILIKKRYHLAQWRLNKLLDCMATDHISTPEKIASLAEDMNKEHQTTQFTNLTTMGEILKLHLYLMLEKPKKQFTGKTSYKVG